MQTPMNEISRIKRGFSFFLFLGEEFEEPSTAGLRGKKIKERKKDK